MPGRLAAALILASAVGACRMPEGRSDGDAIAGFRPDAGAVTLTAPVAQVTKDGEIMLAVEGKPVPVYTGYLRQPVTPGEVLTVWGWAETGGRNRILAQRIVTSDGRRVFPPN